MANISRRPSRSYLKVFDELHRDDFKAQREQLKQAVSDSQVERARRLTATCTSLLKSSAPPTNQSELRTNASPASRVVMADSGRTSTRTERKL